jgi:hypothetical protein
MTTNFFSNLTSRFTTSQELFTWLRSDEGGRLSVRETDGPYAVISYDKKTTDMTMPHVELFRSVVWDKAANKPTCIAPRRGLKFGVAISRGLTEFAVEEFVDGVMINLFYDDYSKVWCPATRTQLGATSHFYGTQPYAELFWKTFASKGLTPEILVPGETYSWVLQHPDERIVVAPAYGIPTLILVESTAPIASIASIVSLAALQPAKYDLKTLEDVKEFVTAEGKRRGHQFQGVVIKADGYRYKLRSNEYDTARTLRGNQPKRPYLWLELWKEGRLNDYLKIYPEEQCEANRVVADLKACTHELHSLYLKVYREKVLPLGQAPQKFRKLIWEAHQAGKGAYFPHLRQFVNDQDTARKLWLVNYDVRYGSQQKRPLFQG